MKCVNGVRFCIRQPWIARELARAQVLRQRRGIAFGRIAEAAATAGLDSHRLAGGKHDAGGLRGQRFFARCSGVAGEPRGPTRLAARQAGRAEYMAVGAHREHNAVAHRPDLPGNTEAAAMAAGATRVRHQCVLIDQ